MNLLLLADMAAMGHGDQVALVAGDEQLTPAELLTAAWTGADWAGGNLMIAILLIALASLFPMITVMFGDENSAKPKP